MRGWRLNYIFPAPYVSGVKTSQAENHAVKCDRVQRIVDMQSKITNWKWSIAQNRESRIQAYVRQSRLHKRILGVLRSTWRMKTESRQTGKMSVPKLLAANIGSTYIPNILNRPPVSAIRISALINSDTEKKRPHGRLCGGKVNQVVKNLHRRIGTVL